jgi:hypothetical protein
LAFDLQLQAGASEEAESGRVVFVPRAVGFFVEPSPAAFGTQSAAQAPATGSDFFNEEGFKDTLGLEVIDEVAEELGELGDAMVAVEAGVDDVAGKEAVLDGVVARGGLALRGARSGGVAGSSAALSELAVGEVRVGRWLGGQDFRRFFGVHPAKMTVMGRRRKGELVHP